MKRKICLVEFLHSQEADGICSLPHRVDLDVDEQLSLTSFLALLLLCTGQHLVHEEPSPSSVE